MTDSVEKSVEEKRIRIKSDLNPESPREWYNIGTMVCWHSRYQLGDETPAARPGEYWRSLLSECDISYEDCLDAIWEILTTWSD